MVSAGCNAWGCPWPAKLRTIPGRDRPNWLCNVHGELAVMRAEDAERRKDRRVLDEYNKLSRRRSRPKARTTTGDS